MKSKFLLTDILSRKFNSMAWINKVSLPKVRFDYEARFDLFSSEIWDIAKRIMIGTRSPDGTESIPICHVTLANGSEQDLYMHLVQHDPMVVFLEVSHCYVDQHFLPFQLWSTDKNKARNYPVDELFQHEVIDERMADGTKVGQLFVKPVQLTIHTSHFDPSPFLPNEDKLSELNHEVNSFPAFTFWRHFEQGHYDKAADALNTLISRPRPDPASTDRPELFLQSLLATCNYWAKDYVAASRRFLSAAEGYFSLQLDRIGDVCIFFAIEAGKRLADKNAAFRTADQIVQQLPFLSARYRTEVANILRSYYSGVYVGTAVLCRRVVELCLADLLTNKHGNTFSISQLIKSAKASGKIQKSIGPGLFGILAVALADGVIGSKEYEIASHIKDFGNNIHQRGGVENEVDAKYAIQSCIHLLHRT